MVKSRIIAVALKDQDGMIYTVDRPGRHHHLLKLCAICNPIEWEQGFTTDQGNFVDRVEARRIAKAAGQISGQTLHRFELFSEDLW